VPSLNATVCVKGAEDEAHARRLAFRRYAMHTGDSWLALREWAGELPPEWVDAEVTRG